MVHLSSTTPLTKGGKQSVLGYKDRLAKKPHIVGDATVGILKRKINQTFINLPGR